MLPVLRRRREGILITCKCNSGDHGSPLWLLIEWLAGYTSSTAVSTEKMGGK